MDYYKRDSSTNRLYRIYKAMKSRCYNPRVPNYNIYGGRGIRICDDWLNNYDSFCTWALENNYSDELSIDRIDNNGNYEPSNCRWSNRYEQQNNTSRNIFVTIDGDTKTVSEWARVYGISLHTIYGRTREGWPIVKAITTPSKGKKNLDFEYHGVTKSIPKWAKEYGICKSTLKYRLLSGWSIEDALNTPVRQLKTGG